MALGLCLGFSAGLLCLPLLTVFAVRLSARLRSAIAFGVGTNWPPYDVSDLSRPSPRWVQLSTRLLGLLAHSETVGAFEGLANAVPLMVKSPNGMVSGLRLSPTAQKKTKTVVYLHGQAGNAVVQHRTDLYKLLATRLGCEVIAIDYCGCGYSDFCWPTEASAVADVRAVVQSLPPEEEVVIWGHSLGTGIALASLEALLADEGRRVRGVILEAPFLSFAAAAGSLLEAVLPWRSLREGLERWVRDGWGDLQFDSARRVQAVAAKMPARAPAPVTSAKRRWLKSRETQVVILHGTDDGKEALRVGWSAVPCLPLDIFALDMLHNDIWAQPGLPQLLKETFEQLYLLAALEVEKFKNKTLDAQMTGATQGTMTTAQTLQSLVTQDQSVSSDRALESPWRGCEAYHIYLLSQRQLYEGQFEQAMKTSLRLAEYEDILDTQTIYSLIALTTYYNKFYMQCSKAFIKLEASGDISDEMRTKFSDLALSIFTRSTPKDPVNQLLLPCPKCHTRISDWSVSCSSCNHRLAFCVASGRSIFPEDRGPNSGPYPPGTGPLGETIKCRVCRHRMYASEVRKLRNCPLCHSRLDIPAPPPMH
ncbi:Wdr35 [Symbiodinium natans]|uniref:Wdr35 protein n=1 Tax=Symbiodinium natans TaxID=878477 RepID=A0A812TXU9_9DINO|nr:Wdr35 [Symbiodinium natans]